MHFQAHKNIVTGMMGMWTFNGLSIGQDDSFEFYQK